MVYVPQADIRHSSQDADSWFRLLEDRVTGKNRVMDRRRKDNDKKAKVAILDSGIDASHPQFSDYPMDGGMSRFRGLGTTIAGIGPDLLQHMIEWDTVLMRQH